MVLFLRVLAVSVAALITASSIPVRAATEPLRIGAILSYSGPSAPLGLPQVNALKLAETQINAHGGVNGRPIHFEIVDDEAKPDVAAQLATQQISSGVAAIICGTRVDSTNAVARVTAQSNVLQIILTPTVTTWKNKNGSVVKTVFETQASDEVESKALFAYAKRKLGVKRVAIIHDANFFGTSGAEIATGEAKTEGVEIVGNEAYASDATDFTPQIQKLTATNPDAILMWGAATAPALVTKAIRTLGYSKPILASGGVDSDVYLKITGSAANGVYAAGSLSKAHPTAEQRQLLDLYEKAYHEPAVQFAAQAWDAAIVVTAVLKATNGKTDGKTLADWLEKGTPIPGAMATYRYSATDHNGQSVQSVHIILPKNGAWTDAPV